MVGEVNFFDSIDYLEPKCPKCGNVLDYGVTTKFDERKNAHICIKCGYVLE